MDDKIPEEEKTRRLTIVQEKQRAIQIRRNSDLIGKVEEVLVEGRNQALGQWIGDLHSRINETRRLFTAFEKLRRVAGYSAETSG